MTRKRTARIILILILAGVIFYVATMQESERQPTISSGKDLEVSYIDVGQGDAILIDYGTYDILIDGGDNGAGKIIVDYLDSRKVDDLELLISTHPHADHVGGLDDVLSAYDVEKVIWSGLKKDTKTFEAYWKAVENEGCEVIEDSDVTINIGDGVELKIIETGDDFTDTNNYSVVVELHYNQTGFLFTGDMEATAEKEALNKFSDIDVLKVGHHGSHSSTSQEFFKVIQPEYAVISCGMDNKYNHPHKESMELFEKNGVEVFRTDLMGTIVVTTDGLNIKVNTQR